MNVGGKGVTLQAVLNKGTNQNKEHIWNEVSMLELGSVKGG